MTSDQQPGDVPPAFRRSQPKAAPILLDELAEALGITLEEAAESVERLIEDGWLTPLGDGRHALTMPYEAR
jgi:hypothetical protein